MKLQRSLVAGFAGWFAVLTGGDVSGISIPIFSPSDAILAIDSDLNSRSNYPGGEPPAAILDNDAGTKYLNFGQRNTGVIVTPSVLSAIGSFTIRTANDAPERDPVTWQISGTNDPITSPDNSAGDSENWTTIASGSVTLPDERGVLGPVVPVPGASAFSSYRIVFPSLKDNLSANSLQIADLNLFASGDGTGSSLVGVGTPARAIHRPTSESRYPGAEGPANLLDNNTGTKYLNFGRENSGVIVTPASGASIVGGFAITTANDFLERDPTSYRLYGTNDPVLSGDLSAANGGEVWTLISQGPIALPAARFASSGIFLVPNNVSYTSYRIEFPTIVGPPGGLVDSLQISGLQFYAVPEPASVSLVAWSLAGVLLLRKKR